MSKIAELNKLMEQAEQLRNSIKGEDLTVEINEIVKQLETAGSSFKALLQYHPELPQNEKLKAALSVFGSSVKVTNKNKIPSVEALSTFLGTGEKSKGEIAAHFQVTSAHVHGFLKKHEKSFTSRAEDKNNKLSKRLYSVKPQAGKRS
jgi:hypothetical protein